MLLSFTDAELERYSRHILLPQIGAEGQARLRESAILVIGAGGLGAPLLQQLAASGVGTIGLVDHDRVELSNLQRQVLYGTPDIGRLKTEAAAERLTALNPLVKVAIYPYRADESALNALVANYDVICDGTDDVPTRLAVSDACVRHGRTLVSGAVQGFSGQMAVFRPQTGGPCYRCLYPDIASHKGRGCNDAGVLGPATAVMGSLMAVEVLREILALEGREETRLTVWDALSSTMQNFRLERNADCPFHGGQGGHDGG